MPPRLLRRLTSKPFFHNHINFCIRRLWQSQPSTMQLIISQTKFPMFARNLDPLLSRFHLSRQNGKRKPAINSSEAQKNSWTFLVPSKILKIGGQRELKGQAYGQALRIGQLEVRRSNPKPCKSINMKVSSKTLIGTLTIASYVSLGSAIIRRLSSTVVDSKVDCQLLLELSWPNLNTQPWVGLGDEKHLGRTGIEPRFSCTSSIHSKH